MIAVVDCGVSNVRSVVNMLRRAGAEAEATADRARIEAAGKIVLPGVGAFARCMTNLRQLELVDTLTTAALQRRVPILGLCLGMQLMTRTSEEGGATGLGWFDADTRRFSADRDAGIKVPHMGWNEVELAKADPVVNSLPAEPRFYFVHSYYVQCAEPEDVLLWSTHGHRFAAGIRRGNLWGMQFHPEKSHQYGLALMRGFVGLP